MDELMAAVYFFVTFRPLSHGVSNDGQANTGLCSRFWENSAWVITAFFARAPAVKIGFAPGAWRYCPGIIVTAAAAASLLLQNSRKVFIALIVSLAHPYSIGLDRRYAMRFQSIRR